VPTLTIGRADHPLEREADRVAERVMWRAAPATPRLAATEATLQRKCAACEAEAARLARKETGGVARGGGAAPDIVHQVLASPGRPLDTAAREFFEPRFGRDLSHVRTHADPTAAASARAVGAQAYTVGHHVAFATGRYQPGNEAGLRLMAHEIAHVEQQVSSGRADTASTLRREADDDAEHDDGEDRAEPDYDGQADASWDELDRDGQGQEGGSQGGEPELGSDFTGGGGESGGGGSDDTYGEPDQGSGEAPGADYQQDTDGAPGAGDHQGSGDAGSDEDGGGLTIDFADRELFGSMRKCGTWSFASGEVPIYTAHFKVPQVGPVDVTIYVRGTASLTACAVLGPGQLRKIRLTLDPLGGSYRGTAELAIPATLTGDLALSGTSGEHADYAGIFELIRGEGTLTGQGKAVNTTTYTIGVQAQYNGGNFSFDVNEALTNCLALTLKASAGADIFALGCPTPCLSGHWDVDNWATGECWNLGLQLGYGAGGFDYDIEGSDLSLDQLLLASLGSATPTGVIGGLIDCLLKPCGETAKYVSAPPEATPGSPGMASGPITSALGNQPTGLSRNDPINMIWFKPLSAYPNPIWLKFDPDNPKERKEPFKRDERQQLPSGQGRQRRWIGVPHWPSVRDVLLRNKTKDTGQKGQFRSELAECGYEWDRADRRYEADHVQDLAFAGADSFKNLWPLEANTNEQAGTWHTWQDVRYSDPLDPPGSPARIAPIFQLAGRWFVITEVRRPF
jgi:hypothetical protein